MNEKRRWTTALGRALAEARGQEPRPRPLSFAQRDALTLMAAGVSVNEIADRRSTSRKSVYVQLDEASRTLGATNPLHLLALALRTGEIKAGDVIRAMERESNGGRL